MNSLHILLIVIILLIDFLLLNKDNKAAIYVYISLVVLVAGVIIIDKYSLVKAGPIEVLIEKMSPVLTWVETILK